MEALAEAFAQLGARAEVIPMAPTVEADIVVVDSYERRADGGWAGGGMVVAVDDLDRDLEVDVVVDPSPGGTGEAHQRAPMVLVGVRYALIGPNLPHRPPTPAVDVASILVTTGGHDPQGRAWGIARRIARRCPGTEVSCTGGPAVPDLREGVLAVETTSGLGPVLARADLVVCAGGVTLLESLALGRPTVVVVVAENQARAAAAVVEAGAAVAATEDDAASTAAVLVDDRDRRMGLSSRARHLVDRRGPSRVASVVLRQRSRIRR